MIFPYGLKVRNLERAPIAGGKVMVQHRVLGHILRERALPFGMVGYHREGQDPDRGDGRSDIIESGMIRTDQRRNCAQGALRKLLDTRTLVKLTDAIEQRVAIVLADGCHKRSLSSWTLQEYDIRRMVQPMF